MSNLTSANTFYKTFTASDSLAFAIFPNSKPISLGSVTTISYSIYREKRPVPLIGKINAAGYTRGMRSISGTLIFTLINQHFVRDLVEQIPYLKEHGKLKCDELPYFDIMIINANEMGASCQMMIYGVDLFEEGQVLSIQDMFIENNIGFVARDLDEFTTQSPLNDSITGGKIKNISKIKDFDMFGKNHYKQENVIEDVQKKLNELNLLNSSDITGVYNNKTLSAINKYQIKNNLNVALLNDATYNSIVNGFSTCTVINRNGAFLYDENKNILAHIKYGTDLTYIAKDNIVKFFDVYGYLNDSDFSLKKDKVKEVTIKVNSISDIDVELNKSFVNSIIYYNNEVKKLSYEINNNLNENLSILSLNKNLEKANKVISYIFKDGVLKERITLKIGGELWQQK